MFPAAKISTIAPKLAPPQSSFLISYEIIDDPEPFYGEVPELQGLWATGKTFEECRMNLRDALEDWIAAHLVWGYPVSFLQGHMIQVSKEPMAVAD
jgi:predicted RNase H-like HicB family nuclease